MTAASRSGSRWSGGTRNGMPADLILRFALTRRCARLGRRAVARPALGGQRKRLLSGLLGEVEVAEEADQGRDDASPLVVERALELVQRSTSGLTSIAPPMRAAGMRAASSIAAS